MTNESICTYLSIPPLTDLMIETVTQEYYGVPDCALGSKLKYVYPLNASDHMIENRLPLVVPAPKFLFSLLPSMLAARRDYSPSSSPPSSTGPIDSSPPSSPGYNYAELNAPSIGLTHPFAASAKAVKCPPNYEKDRKKNKRPNSPQLLPDSPSKSKRARYLERRDSVDDVPIPAFPADFSTLSSRCHSPELTLEDIEEQEWDRASAAVIDQVNGSVDLE